MPRTTAAAALILSILPGFGAVSSKLNDIPIYFEPNQGQFDPQVRYLARGAKYLAWVTDSKLVLDFGDASAPVVIQFGPPSLRPRHAEGLERQRGTTGYYLGNRPAEWIQNVPSFAKAKLLDVYPGIDVIFYGHNETREIEYDFMVKPGADPALISIDFDPRLKPRAGPLGEITMDTSAGTMQHQIPRVHQDGKTVMYRSTFDGARLKLEMGDYDVSRTLVVDPRILFQQQFIPGSVSDTVKSLAIDFEGATYVAGTANAVDFPWLNFVGPRLPNRQYASVTKIAGVTLGGTYPRVYTAYVGGRRVSFGNNLLTWRYEKATGIAVDANGAAYVSGLTNSPDFPALRAYDSDFSSPNDHGFLFKISATAAQGGHDLTYATHLGEIMVASDVHVAVDAAGSPWVGTLPFSITDTPDIRLARFASTPSGNGTYERIAVLTYGSTAYDHLCGIALDRAGAVYIAGNSNGNNLPAVRAAIPIAPEPLWRNNSFVAKYVPVSTASPSQYQLEYSTYLGGSLNDLALGIAVDSTGAAYVAGWTASDDFSGAVSPTIGGFLVKISGVVSGSIYPIVYSSAGVDFETIRAVAIGPGDSIFLAGSSKKASQADRSYPLLVKMNSSERAYSVAFRTGLSDMSGDAAALAIDRLGQATVGGYKNDSPDQTRTASFVTRLSGEDNLSTVAIFSSPGVVRFTTAGSGCNPGEYTTPQNFAWPLGAVCTITIAASNAGVGLQTWENGSTDSVRTVVASGVLQVLEARLGPRYPLTVMTEPAGGGSVQPGGGNFYASGTKVRLSAVAAPGWFFHYWSGITGRRTQPTLDVVMDSAKTIVAHFAKLPEGQGQGLEFVPVYPCRVDESSLLEGEVREVRVTAKAACGVPAEAAAYSLNLQVAPEGGPAEVEIWPSSQARSGLAQVISPDGRSKSSAAIVTAGVNGTVSVSATASTQLAIDVNGYFIAPKSGSLAFYSIVPCRVADTRSGAKLTPGVLQTFDIPATACGVPVTAKAYALHATVVPSKSLAGLTLWPSGIGTPESVLVSSLNGGVASNGAIVQAGVEGLIDALATDETDVVLDINGYFAPAGAPGGTRYYPVPPCREFDTPTPGIPATYVFRSCGVPETARAASLIATVAPVDPLPFLTLWTPELVELPLASMLAAADGVATSNAAFAELFLGKISLFAGGTRGRITIDVNGYFAP